MREIKCNSSKHFNDQHRSINKIGWQDGYGAFTVSKSQVPAVVRYIQNQESHHAKHSFEFDRVDERLFERICGLEPMALARRLPPWPVAGLRPRNHALSVDAIAFARSTSSAVALRPRRPERT